MPGFAYNFDVEKFALAFAHRPRLVGAGSWWAAMLPMDIASSFSARRVDLYPYLDGIVAR